MERFDSTVPPTYFRHARAVIFVYAVNSQESIDNIVHWSESIAPQRLGPQRTKMICALVGNKADDENREVTFKRGRDTADVCGFDKDLVFEVSAKTGDGVDEMFDAIADRMEQTGEGTLSSQQRLSKAADKKIVGCCSSS